MKKTLALVLVCLAASVPPALGLPPTLSWRFAGWYGGGAYPMIVPDPSQAGRVYLISDVGGVWESADRGNLWEYRTAGLQNLKIVNLAVAPSNPDVLYCGTPQGIHRSADGGTTWTLLSATRGRVLFSRPSNYRSLVVDPADANRVFAGTRTGEIFQTVDGGVTWTSLGLPFGAAAVSALHLSADRAFLYAGTASSLRRYRFGTATWETTTLAAQKAFDIATYGSGTTMYVTSGTRVAWTSDAGATWQYSAALPVTGDAYRLAVAPGSGGVRILVAWRNGWSGGTLLSENSGVSWTDIERNLTHDVTGSPTRVWSRAFGWPLSCAIDPFDSRVFYFTDFWGVWRSDDGGGSWQERVRGAPNTIGSDIAVPGNGRVYVATMDNGLVFSSDGGVTVRSLAPSSQADTSMNGHVWRVNVNGQKVVATNSPWDAGPNQVLVSEDGGATWTKTRSGLPPAYPTSNVVWDKGYARALARDPTDPRRYYLGIDGDNGGGFYYSLDGAYTWTRSAGQPGSLRIYNGLAVDPVEPHRIFWGTTNGLYRTENYGTNWSLVLSGYVFDVAVGADQHAYAGADSAGPTLYISRNKGSSWTTLKKFEGSGTCEGIAIDPSNPQRIAVSVVKWDGWAPCKIYLTENQGVTWTDVTADLPPGAGAAAMAFTPDGSALYMSRDSGTAYYLPLTAGDTTAPSIPAGFTAIAQGDVAVNLAWQASMDDTAVTGYRVWRDGQQLATTTELSYTDASPAFGTHRYAVTAFDAAGNVSGQSVAQDVTFADVTPPSAPANLGLSVANDTVVTLSWQASLDNAGVTGYDVVRDGAPVGTTPTTTYTDSSTVLGRTYAYAVKARDSAGNVSAASNTVSVTLTDTTPPSIPSGLTARPGDARVDLTWNSVQDASLSGYGVYRNGVQLAFVPDPATEFTDTTARNATTYSYTVTCADEAGNECAPSAPVTATPVDATPPAAPAGLTAAAFDREVTLSWPPSAEPDVSGYHVYRSISGGSFSKLTPVSQVATAFADTGLQNGVTYGYRVTAVDAGGNESQPSSSVTVAPQSTAPQGPVLHWPFDADALDASGNGNHADASVIDYVSPPPGSGGLDGDAKLMLHFDGAAGAATFVDDSEAPHAVTRVGTVRVDAAQFKFGGGSAAFDGPGNYLSLDDSPDWDAGRGDFTLDYWVRFRTVAALQRLSEIGHYAAGGFLTQWSGSALQIYLNGQPQTFAWNPRPDTWYHLAFVRKSGVLRVYVNGARLGTDRTELSNLAASTIGSSIGEAKSIAGYPLHGWIDEFRWSKGVARWWENFEPPGAPYSRSGSIPDTHALFSPPVSHVTRSNLAGLRGDGFSAALWVKTQAPNAGTPLSYASASGGGARPDNAFTLHDTRNLQVHRGDAAAVTGVSVNDGRWHHVAVTWSQGSGETNLYKDGVVAWTGTLAPRVALPMGGTLVAGQEQDSVGGSFDAAQALDGAMDDVRLYARALAPEEVAALVTTLDITAPPAPSGFAAVSGDSAVTLSWQAVMAPDLKETVVFRDGVRLASVSKPGVTYVDRAVTNGPTYSYSAASVDMAGNQSLPSAVVPARPLDLAAPPVPSGLAARAGDARVDLSWMAVAAPDLKEYAVYRNGTRIAVAAAPALTHADTAVTNGVAYQYAVSAIDISGNESAASTPVGATPRVPPPNLGIDEFTRLMIHADGPDGFSVFLDDSPTPHTVLRIGSVRVDIAQSKFGGGSALFEGAGDYLSLGDSPDWDAGRGDFTLDYWVRFRNVTALQRLSEIGNYVAGGFLTQWSGSALQIYVNGQPHTYAWSPRAHTWYHLAFVRKSGVLRVFANGVRLGTDRQENGNLAGSVSGASIGEAKTIAAYSFAGWIDEFRWSKGVARWWENFEPPSTEYQ